MSDFEQLLLFEADFERMTDALEAERATHAHTGEGCIFCRDFTGAVAKVNGTTAVTRDLEWWNRSWEWLDDKPAGFRFTADDLVADLGKPEGSVNQIGARLRTWAIAERIDPVGFDEATRPESHARVLRVWEVNL